MSVHASTPVIIDIEMSVVLDVLERARGVLSHEDHRCLEGLVKTFIELSKLVRERGTTIARLRRLFGLLRSEKAADVLGKDAPPAAAATQDRRGCDDEASSESAGEQGDDRPGAADTPEPKTAPKGHGRIPASGYPNARRTRVEHPTLRAGDMCPCCARSTLYRLREPATLVRIKGQSPLVAEAWDMDRLRCGGCGEVFTARAPAEAQGPKYDESAASMMALLRYRAGMPLHRLEQLQGHLDTPVPASTQWELVRDRAAALEPVYQQLGRLAAQGRLLHNDDTSIRILEFMGKRRADLLEQGKLPDPDRTGLFTTAVVAVTDAGPMALFFSGRKHAGENLGELLDQRDPALAPPIQMCDGLDRNWPSEHDVLESNCLAHGRRHIVDEVDNFPGECRHVLEALGQVFKNESICIEQGLCSQDRLAFHQRESGPVMAALQTWIRAELDDKRVEPNSGLGQAYRYLLKRWDPLTLLLRVPDAPLENNLCERALKMAIRQRNNSLFYRSQRGAKVGDIYMTLIYTAELHRQNPFHYLTALLEHEAAVAADPAARLPWTYRNALARASPATIENHEQAHSR
jgi:transposase